MVLNHRCRPWLAALVLLFPDVTQSALAAEQKMAQIGSLKVTGGQLKECSLGYRLYGTLAADQSNVVLFPSWAGASTADLEKWIGPGQLVDSSKWFVVAVDALGNGVSCSPSNSRSTPLRRFPSYSIRDVVRAQHKMLTLELGIDHLHGIIGIGMGSMQALQWAVTYQDFADRLVLVSATAQPTELDRKRWDGQLRLMEADGKPAIDTIDSYWQWQAMRAFDLVGSGDMATLAKKIKARLLVIASLKDTMVDPDSARRLAAEARQARYLLLDGLCADLDAACEAREVAAAVAQFLDRP